MAGMRVRPDLGVLLFKTKQDSDRESWELWVDSMILVRGITCVSDSVLDMLTTLGYTVLLESPTMTNVWSDGQWHSLTEAVNCFMRGFSAGTSGVQPELSGCPSMV